MDMMKTLGKIQYMAVVLFLAATLWSCNEENVVPVPEGEGAPIAFATNDGWDVRTRADGNSAPSNDFPNGTQMGLFAFYIPSGGSLDVTQVPNFMNNEDVVASTTEKDKNFITSWSYSPVKYWPHAKGDALSFFGYYPWVPDAMLDEVNYTLDGTKNVMWINKVNNTPVAVTGEDDGVTTFNPNNLTTSADCPNGAVSLNFEHKLMRLRFEFLAKVRMVVKDANGTETVKNPDGFEHEPYVENLIVKPAESAVLHSGLVLNPINGEARFDDTNQTNGFRLLRGAEGERKERFFAYNDTDNKDKNIVAGEMFIDPVADDETLAEEDQVKSLTLDINISGLVSSVNIVLKKPAPGRSYLVELTFDKHTNSVESTLTHETWETYTINENDSDIPIIRD